MEYRGLTPEKRVETRKRKIVYSLIENSKTYSKLYRDVGKRWSKRDFTKYVQELQRNFIVGKRKGADGKVKYMVLKESLGNDYEILQKMYEWDKELEVKMKEFVKVINETERPSQKETRGFVTVFVRSSLRDYLEGIESVALTSEKLRGYVRWFLIRQTDKTSWLE